VPPLSGHHAPSPTDACLDSLSEADLDREVEFFGRKIPVAALLLGPMCIHIAKHSGEFSSLKGLRGLRGNPT
jgi:hypothetical protein